MGNYKIGDFQTMGTCYGRCLLAKNRNSNCNFSSSESVEQQRNLVMDSDNNNNNTNNDLNHRNTNSNTFIFRIMKTKEKKHSKSLKRFWEQHIKNSIIYSRLTVSTNDTTPTTNTNSNNNSNYSINEIQLQITPNRSSTLPKTELTSYYDDGDIQLQCLDAQNLHLLHQHSISSSSTNNNCNVPSSHHNGKINFGNKSTIITTSPSPASSSLDLEWEHEYHNKMNYYFYNTDKSSSFSKDSTTIEDDEFVFSDNELINSNQLELSKLNNQQKLTPEGEYEVDTSLATTAASPTFINSKTKSKQHNHHHHHHVIKSINNSWSHISTPESLEWDVNNDGHELKSEECSLDNETIELLQEIEWLKNRALNETGTGTLRCRLKNQSTFERMDDSS